MSGSFLQKSALLILGLIQSLLIMAADTDSLIKAGNKYYNEGLYNDAVSMYEKVLDENYESAALYYNLGNAYFKTRDMAAAILYYEKALKLNPDNPDLLHNLQVANSKIADNIEEVPEFFLKRWWNNLYSAFSADTWSYIAVALFFILLIFAVVFFIAYNRKTRIISFWGGIIFLILSTSGFLIANEKYQHTRQNNEAIVFSPTVTVKSSPTRNSVDLFVLHEGTKVRLLDEVSDWYEIRIANGSVGWLPESAVRKI